MSDMGDALWNTEVGPAEYSVADDRYRQAVLDQYKLCVEMADRVSARRNLTNTFFLSLNSAVVAVVAAWYVMVRSYRQLNRAKYAVIGAFEERLPAFAYSRGEWGALGEGRDWRRYLPLTYVEQWVPVVFAGSYVTGFFALVTR